MSGVNNGALMVWWFGEKESWDFEISHKSCRVKKGATNSQEGKKHGRGALGRPFWDDRSSRTVPNLYQNITHGGPAWNLLLCGNR